MYHFGSSLLKHSLKHANLDPNMKLSGVPEDIESVLSVDKVKSLISSLKQEGTSIINTLVNGESQGYIIYIVALLVIFVSLELLVFIVA